MPTQTDVRAPGAGTAFLSSNALPEEVFTREDLSPAQQMFGRIAEDFMRTEVVPRDAAIHAKNWPLTRELLLKAADLDLLRVDIPEAYGGRGAGEGRRALLG